MGNLGFQEILLIFVLALIIFGPRKLPEIGKTLGRSLNEFRKATTDLRSSWEEEVRIESEKLKQDVELGKLKQDLDLDNLKQDFESIDPKSGDHPDR